MSQLLNEVAAWVDELYGPKDHDPATAQSVDDPLTLLGNRTKALKYRQELLEHAVEAIPERIDSLLRRIIDVEHGNVEFTRTNVPMQLFNGQSTADTKTIQNVKFPFPVWSAHEGRMSTKALVDTGGGDITSPSARSEYKLSVDAESVKILKRVDVTLAVMGSVMNPATPINTDAAKAYGTAQSAAQWAAYQAALQQLAVAQAAYDAQRLTYNNVDTRKNDYYNQRAEYLKQEGQYFATLTNSTYFPGAADYNTYIARHNDLEAWGDSRPGATKPTWVNSSDLAGTGVGKGIVTNGITEHWPGKSGVWYTAARGYLFVDAGYHFNDRAIRDLTASPPSDAEIIAKKKTSDDAYKAWLTAYNVAYNQYITNNPGSDASPGGSINLVQPNAPVVTLYEVQGASDPVAVSASGPATYTNKVYTITLVPDKRINPAATYYVAVRPGFYSNKMLRTDLISITSSYVE